MITITLTFTFILMISVLCFIYSYYVLLIGLCFILCLGLTGLFVLLCVFTRIDYILFLFYKLLEQKEPKTDLLRQEPMVHGFYHVLFELIFVLNLISSPLIL